MLLALSPVIVTIRVMRISIHMPVRDSEFLANPVRITRASHFSHMSISVLWTELEYKLYSLLTVPDILTGLEENCIQYLYSGKSTTVEFYTRRVVNFQKCGDLIPSSIDLRMNETPEKICSDHSHINSCREFR